MTVTKTTYQCQVNAELVILHVGISLMTGMRISFQKFDMCSFCRPSSALVNSCPRAIGSTSLCVLLSMPQDLEAYNRLTCSMPKLRNTSGKKTLRVVEVETKIMSKSDCVYFNAFVQLFPYTTPCMSSCLAAHTHLLHKSQPAKWETRSSKPTA
jgi:hypothetical protein